eukprot:7391125-Prymnesium_polylepis.1
MLRAKWRSGCCGRGGARPPSLASRVAPQSLRSLYLLQRRQLQFEATQVGHCAREREMSARERESGEREICALSSLPWRRAKSHTLSIGWSHPVRRRPAAGDGVGCARRARRHGVRGVRTDDRDGGSRGCEGWRARWRAGGGARSAHEPDGGGALPDRGGGGAARHGAAGPSRRLRRPTRLSASPIRPPVRATPSSRARLQGATMEGTWKRPLTPRDYRAQRWRGRGRGH